MKNAGRILNAIYGLKSTDSAKFEELKYSSVMDLVTYADEAMGSKQDGYGEEFVQGPVLLKEVLKRVSEKDSLLNSFQKRDMIAAIVDVPASKQKIEMQYFEEDDNVPANLGKTKAGTATVRLEAKQLVVNIYFTKILLEDSVVNFINFIEGELSDAFDTSIHNVLINGDTATAENTNINVIDGTPTANKAYLAIDGLRKKALVSGTTVDCGTAGIEDIRALKGKLGLKGVTPKDLVLTCNSQVYNVILGMYTLGSYPNGVIEYKDGVITKIDGIRLVVREEVKNAKADGKISATASNNTKGALLVVHTPSALVGFRRTLEIESDYTPSTQQICYTGSTRVAFNLNENDGVAVAYGINITL